MQEHHGVMVRQQKVAVFGDIAHRPGQCRRIISSEVGLGLVCEWVSE